MNSSVPDPRFSILQDAQQLVERLAFCFAVEQDVAFQARLRSLITTINGWVRFDCEFVRGGTSLATRNRCSAMRSISPDRPKDWPATTSAFEAFAERRQPHFSKVGGSTNRLA